MKKNLKFLFYLLFAGLIMLNAKSLTAQDYVVDLKIHITKSKGTIYQLLNQISEQSDYLLIYDSQLIDNDKEVKIKKGYYKIIDAIRTITGNSLLDVKIIGNHILIYLPIDQEKFSPKNVEPQQEKFFTIEGLLKDHITGEPVIYCSIGVVNHTYATISNQKGEFKLILPDSLLKSTIKISHLGYISREIEASILAKKHIVFYLDQKIIPLQEIVIRVIDPIYTIREMLNQKSRNYATDPVYLTTFYREGIDYKNGINLTEAVLQIYKTGIGSTSNTEQVKMLKMRRVSNEQGKDTLVTKIKSSVGSCLLLDLVKNPPDFLSQDLGSQYNFSHIDIKTIDDRRVYVLFFEQKSGITEPLFTGELFIDAENYALLQARFEVNQKYVDKAADELVIKKSHHIEISSQKVEYIVSYKPINGLYYINHIRGDLNFKVKKKRRLFSSNLHVWFEMVNCKIDTSDVRKFHNNERISTNDIFAENSFAYDHNFWGNFNIILPEDKLKEIIEKYNF